MMQYYATRQPKPCAVSVYKKGKSYKPTKTFRMMMLTECMFQYYNDCCRKDPIALILNTNKKLMF